MASDEEYSDLTELESEEEYVGTTIKKAKKATNGATASKGGWRIKNALKVPRATTYTAQALYDQIYACDINLEPEYQRDVVWSETKQIGIIDSVFRNFYIPPVIFAVNVHDDGSETKTCIDGKQRLTSIHRFMEGLIPHKDPITGEKLWYKDIQSASTKGSKSRRPLPEKYRRLFANKQIVCVEYQDITDADEREIFQRVQLGMALTPAEKLQVIKTSRADFIRELQNTYLKDDGWLGSKHLAWDISRGSDFRGLAQAVCCMDTFASLKTTSISMAQLEKWLSIEEPLKSDVHKRVEDTYRIFAEMVQDTKLNKVFQKPAKISPLEFIVIGLMIFVHKDKVSLAQLSAGIGQMREDVRSEHVDIRMNARVSKTMIEFIKKWVPSMIAGDTGGVASGTKGAGGVKRKRVAKKTANDDDDEEDADDDDAEEHAQQAPKAKKSNTAAGMLMNIKASTSAPRKIAQATPPPPPPPRIKAEPAATPPSIALNPPIDRMAALKRAKEAVAQSQAERSMQIPSGPRALRLPPNPARTNSVPNPQMLPSPSQAYTVPSSLPPVHPTANAPIPSRPAPNAATVDSSLMATMMQLPGLNDPRLAPRPSNLPPPPPSGSSDGGGMYRTGDRDRDRDRDYDHDRSRDRDRYPSSRGHDERDRGRHDPSRRDSGGYGRRSPVPSSSRWAPR
ncbi:hypothetical protein BDZ97DRAFT_1789327 [Flammula alnicola]|nr:hypothetical protein BDZ97DRAFT_1789327 [Flammula alnicola]